MALITLHNHILYPGGLEFNGDAFEGSIATLDAAGEYVAFVFEAKEAMTISHIVFKSGTATGSPTLDVRIETVDTSTGLPTGTLWATNTNIVTGALSSNTVNTVALTASATVAFRDVVCVKLAYNSGTSLTMPMTTAADTSCRPPALPYRVINTGTPAKSAAGQFTMAIGDSSTTFYRVPGLFPYFGSASATTFSGSGQRRGIRFTMPYNCRAIGMKVPYRNANVDFSIALYDDSGTELSSSSTSVIAAIGTLATANAAFRYFDNPVTLTAGTTYRAAVETTGSGVGILIFAIPNSNFRNASHLGTTAQYTSYNGSVWNDSDVTTIPTYDIIIDQIDDGTGGGGGGTGESFAAYVA